jgi:hypothetical protein
VSEETIKDSDGNVYDVTDVTDDKTDIVIIKKNGKILEEQITNSDKDLIAWVGIVTSTAYSFVSDRLNYLFKECVQCLNRLYDITWFGTV